MQIPPLLSWLLTAWNFVITLPGLLDESVLNPRCLNSILPASSLGSAVSGISPGSELSCVYSHGHLANHKAYGSFRC